MRQKDQISGIAGHRRRSSVGASEALRHLSGPGQPKAFHGPGSATIAEINRPLVIPIPLMTVSMRQNTSPAARGR